MESKVLKGFDFVLELFTGTVYIVSSSRDFHPTPLVLSRPLIRRNFWSMALLPTFIIIYLYGGSIMYNAHLYSPYEIIKFAVGEVRRKLEPQTSGASSLHPHYAGLCYEATQLFIENIQKSRNSTPYFILNKFDYSIMNFHWPKIEDLNTSFEHYFQIDPFHLHCIPTMRVYVTKRRNCSLRIYRKVVKRKDSHEPLWLLHRDIVVRNIGVHMLELFTGTVYIVSSSRDFH